MRAFISFGSNLGDRRENILDSLRRLHHVSGIAVKKISPVYETAAEGFLRPAPSFLNGAAELESACSVRDLLGMLLDIERQIGRIRLPSADYQSRLIDLDLLLFGDEILQQPDLIVPHPRMLQRWFVLRPLTDLAPGVRIPGAGISVQEALENLGPYPRPSGFLLEENL
ncbi:MAG: 2-amino-4-hydroxy-6-hydroxymethyldihydropteridine diphosphokinase [Candidatus Omnitrophica bacterium]|nr:2-amino-4-hydroxy-6-hydroxymethyldihydropteridine diphosphokinase [Candidatus Omnitrophota bacterium]